MANRKAFAFLATVCAAQMNDQELLTASQAAEALSASSQTIRNWIRSNRLQAVRIGNRFLIPRDEVDRMRGEARSQVGESPWAFGNDDPAPPLPRAADTQPAVDPAEGLLGG
jgi:excisionase family DNA binding protein